MSTIQKLTGAPWKYVKQAVTSPESIIPGDCPCRYCPAKELTQQEVDFLCSDSTFAIMDDFLSPAAASVICNTFPGQKLIHFKAEKGVSTQSCEVTCNAL